MRLSFPALLVASLFLLAVEACGSPVETPTPQSEGSRVKDFDDRNYAALLEKQTRSGTIGGVEVTAVDYSALAGQSDDPDSLYRRVLDDFASVDPSKGLPATGESPDVLKAFWMNAYNIGAIKMIVDHWPVDSITSRRINVLGSPWKKKILTIGGKEYSLDEIEHKILLGELRELRTHWGIVCASVSCPSLRREPFRADLLDEQLAEQGRLFFSEPHKGARLDREGGKLFATKIYKFDQKNFDTLGGGIGEVVATYREDPKDQEWIRSEGWKLEVFDYDWSLNDIRRLDP